MHRAGRRFTNPRYSALILAASLLVSSTSAFAEDGSTLADPLLKTLPPMDVEAKADQQTAGNATTPVSSSNRNAQDQTDTDKLLAQGSGDSGSNGDLEPDEATPLSDADGQKLAQGVSPGTGQNIKATDPVYNQLPGKVGTVNVRRKFTLFAKQELIHNLSFRDTPVREVLAELARRGGLNVLLDKSVQGRITGDLHDITLNEAMDAVLTAGGLVSRQIDNNTAVIASPNAATQLGLNRSQARVFKLSYTSAFDVASLLQASVFNTGMLPDFQQSLKERFASTEAESPKKQTGETRGQEQATVGEGGAARKTQQTQQITVSTDQRDEKDIGIEAAYNTRLDTSKTVKGTTRLNLQEGTGFNNAAQDPGTQQIRAFQELTMDYVVDQNAGRAICIPDTKNRQVIVVGTPEDLQVAEEAIRLIDRRPKQVHIQVSLIELTNQGVRQLGAALNLQGEGASGTVLGGAGAPLIQFLPGIGSPGAASSFVQSQQIQGTFDPGSSNSNTNIVATLIENLLLANPALSFLRTTTDTQNRTTQNSLLTQATNTLNRAFPILNDVTPSAPPSNAFPGVVGTVVPLTGLPTIAGVQPSGAAQSAFNFLTLDRRAGGRANIATLPTAVNVNVNMLLQTNKAKVLANPSVIVNDNTEALVTLANEVVHKVTSTVSLGVVSTNVELTKAGIFLDVLPKVSQDGFVTMRLRPQVSTPLGAPLTFGGGATVVTLLNVREIIAQDVRVKDGQTLVLGGLFTEQEASQLSKVPYLAEAPLLGAFFRNSIKGRNRTELMLLITPKIVEDGPTAQPPVTGI